MPQYEMVGIIRPDLEGEAVQGVVERIGRRVTEQGGTVDFVEVWGKRRMAFPIRKSREGIYFVSRFTIEKTHLAELKRLTRIMDEMLRALIVLAEGPTPAARTERAERPAEAARAPETEEGRPIAEPAARAQGETSVQAQGEAIASEGEPAAQPQEEPAVLGQGRPAPPAGNEDDESKRGLR